jgi:propionyl-CoA carboxylase alpha chain
VLPEGRIRVENGFQEGDEISVFYDSLLAKVISFGATRSESIAKMKRALKDFSIQGVKSTIPFCLFVLNHEKFVQGEIDTRFVEKHFDPSVLRNKLKENESAAVLGAVLLTQMGATRSVTQSNGKAEITPSKWRDSRREVLR